jgi:ADP-dependent phosphofructokinase/glucokinase|tara:strand:- start:137 stop:376 length:240 start_codon:yes stop_codon:yes gene_type:complete
MKKKALQTLGRVVKSVALGVADNVPVVNSIKANIESELGGKGKYDYIRLASAVATIGVIAAFLMGKLTIEEVERLLDLI